MGDYYIYFSIYRSSKKREHREQREQTCENLDFISVFAFPISVPPIKNTGNKTFFKKFQKSVDNVMIFCYNGITRKGNTLKDKEITK